MGQRSLRRQAAGKWLFSELTSAFASWGYLVTLRARRGHSRDTPVTEIIWAWLGVHRPIAPHEVLEAQALQVLLVDTRQLARVPGRDKKSDPSDCEWIQRLHSCGLLRGSFRPEEAVCRLRTLVRDKANLVAESGDWLRRMQKSLDQMNVRVHRAVSDIDGVTGMAMLRAIAAGERDAQKLAQLRDRRCSKTQQEIAEQLTGHWREDHLFSLQQALKMYDAVQQRIAAYEQEILRQLGAMEEPGQQGQTAPPLHNANKTKAIKKRGQESKRQALYRMSGVDITQIDALGVETVEVVLSEYGPDLSRFPTEKEFVAHVTLAPRVPSSGGKPLKKKKRNSASTRVAAALRMAALSLRHSQTALGRTIASSPNGWAEMLRCSLPPGSWPPSFTGCCAGASHMSTKAQPPTKIAIFSSASKA